MGKKHIQPQPIDIFNVPSPRTLLTGEDRARGGVKRSRDDSARTVSCPSPGTRAGGGDGLFPESPPPEVVADFGDVASDDSHEDLAAAAQKDEVVEDPFSSEGDDGNAEVTSSDEEDDDDDDELDDDDEDSDDGEEGAEMGSGDDEEAALDDAEDAEDVTVHFEAMEMYRSDINHITHLMDQYIPDHMLEVDRDGFGSMLLESSVTTLIKLGNGGDDDDDEFEGPSSAAVAADSDEDGASEVFGMISVLDLVKMNKESSSSSSPHTPTVHAFLSLLKSSLWQVFEPGIAPYDLLTSVTPQNKAKAVLLVAAYIRNVPLEMVSRLLSFAFEEVEKQAKAASSTVAWPCMFVVLAKVQRSSEHPPTKSMRSKGAIGGEPPAKASRAENKMNDFDFWREEDKILFEHRDKRVAVHAYRCRPQYDSQPEGERPVSIAFALSADALQKSISEIKKQETLKPL